MPFWKIFVLIAACCVEFHWLLRIDGLGHGGLPMWVCYLEAVQGAAFIAWLIRKGA